MKLIKKENQAIGKSNIFYCRSIQQLKTRRYNYNKKEREKNSPVFNNLLTA
jgi:hypothetical protein